MIHLAGKSALITGSTRGIGASIARAFAQAGANVLIHSDKDSAEAQQVVFDCRALGVKAEFIACDLAESDVEALQSFADKCFDLLPSLSILVSNAGAYFDVPYLQMDAKRFDRTIRLNVRSPYFLTQRFSERWIASQTRGAVLMIGSVNGKLAEMDSTAYDTSKGAIEMMVKTLAVSLAPNGIRVNGVAPGFVRTGATSWIDAQPDAAKWIALHTPNQAIPNSDVCGPAAVYLCSDFAAHVTGQMLGVDGGLSAWQYPPTPAST